MNEQQISDREQGGGGMKMQMSAPKRGLLDDSDDAQAIGLLQAAITLHEKHMNGTEPTTGKAGEKSQMKMMDLMKQALAALKKQ